MVEALDGVVVTGTGRVGLRPDVLVARFGAEVTGAGVSEVLDRCSATMAAMTEVLRRAQVPERDRQTAAAAVHQAHDRHGQPRGWSASQELSVRLRDLPAAGDLISATVAAGGDAGRLRTVGFELDRDTPEYAAAGTEARRLAFADAQVRAAQYAELAGRRLGVVISVREGDPGYPPAIPMRGATFGAVESAMPVEGGELEVTTMVEVRWELVS